jgi:hypothetical protein
VTRTVLAAWLWQLVDERVREDGDAGEPPVLSDGERAVAGQLSAAIDETWALWRRDDETLALADIDRACARCSEAGSWSDKVGAIYAYLDEVCALVGEIRADHPGAEDDDADAGWFHWVHDVRDKPIGHGPSPISCANHGRCFRSPTPPIAPLGSWPIEQSTRTDPAAARAGLANNEVAASIESRIQTVQTADSLLTF